jgi:signal transduction histidine kinase
VIDHKPNTLTDSQLSALEALRNQVVKLFELRSANQKLKEQQLIITENKKALENFARVAAHDIKSPAGSIAMIADFIKNYKNDKLDSEVLSYIDDINKLSRRLLNMIDGILQYSINANVVQSEKSTINVYSCVEDTLTFTTNNSNSKIKIDIAPNLEIFAYKTALEQVLLNLVNNGLKYNNNPIPEMTIKAVEQENMIVFDISDNGPGITKNDQERIFKLFETTSNKDSSGFTGTGIGLATVKSLLKMMGGEIALVSEPQKGTTFTFNIPKA